MIAAFLLTHLMILLTWSMVVSSGLSPPCMQIIFSSTIAAQGRQLKQSVKVFQSLMPKRRCDEAKARSVEGGH